MGVYDDGAVFRSMTKVKGEAVEVWQGSCETGIK